VVSSGCSRAPQTDGSRVFLSRCPILSPKVRNDIADQAKRASVEEAHRLLAEVLELLRPGGFRTVWCWREHVRSLTGSPAGSGRPGAALPPQVSVTIRSAVGSGRPDARSGLGRDAPGWECRPRPVRPPPTARTRRRGRAYARLRTAAAQPVQPLRQGPESQHIIFAVFQKGL
jgi:hypothetical protein